MRCDPLWMKTQENKKTRVGEFGAEGADKIATPNINILMKPNKP